MTLSRLLVVRLSWKLEVSSLAAFPLPPLCLQLMHTSMLQLDDLVYKTSSFQISLFRTILDHMMPLPTSQLPLLEQLPLFLK
jgi:hypothetical protein